MARCDTRSSSHLLPWRRSGPLLGWTGSSRASTTCWLSRSRRPCSSNTSEATSTTAASTAASVGGAGSWHSTRPHTIAFSWDVGPDWQVASDLERTSEVEITFTAEGETQTRVTLVHRHLDRHGDGWESMRDGVEAEDGWPLYLARYSALTRGELDAT